MIQADFTWAVMAADGKGKSHLEIIETDKTKAEIRYV